MIALLSFFLALLVSSFKSKSRLEAENAALRHQLIVLQRRGARSRPTHERRSLVLGHAVSMVFERLFAFLVLGHGRRQLLWFEVTRHPTAEWLARQITEVSLPKTPSI
jgi:hypothetical protein